ncbi:MAG TPA: hypothetical protein ENJ18_16050 [Nannocystis exedens]|nr:hypothetical protein [Nannocystis exedens]
MESRKPVSDGKVAIAWVLVDNALRHVSDFVELPPGSRPNPTCAVCRRTVVLRLGTIRAHHAAHRKGAICPTTKPLYALYFNCKVHIGKALETASKLRVGLKCKNKSRCHHRRIVDWIDDWDRVEIETAMGSMKPDITLFQEDKAIASIDVAVSPTLDIDKGAERERTPMPWAVVRVSTNSYHGFLGWTPHNVLDIEAGTFEDAECLNCVQRRKSKDDWRASQKANRLEARYFRIVDFYYPDGRSLHKIFSTHLEYADSERSAMLLKRNGKMLLRVPWTNEAETMKALQAAFQEDVSTFGADAIIDYRNKWCTVKQHKSPAEAMRKVPTGNLKWRAKKWITSQ